MFAAPAGGPHRQRYGLLTRGGQRFKPTPVYYAQLQVRTTLQHINLHHITSTVTHTANVRLFIGFDSEYMHPSWFLLPAVSCCAVRVKSLWPRSHPIRRADTSRGTTLTTRTLRSTLTRRWSWSTRCWRSLRCPRRPTSSTWRSATARRPSDPTHVPTT